MELIDGTRSKAKKSATEVHDDIISSMPENVVTNILDSLPIKDAVRTGILSRTWRFKWTMLTQIVFDFDKYYDERDLSIFLLQLVGPITKFVLHIPNNKVVDVKDINHWTMFLSRKGIKEFTLINIHPIPLKLPSHLFSCIELKHLRLHNCCFHLPPTFCGFPNLLSLDLFLVTFESDSYGQLITRCPLLEILKVSNDPYNPSGKLKLVEIANLKNLRVLSLQICKLDYMGTAISIVCELGSYFPRLRKLILDFYNSEFPREFDESEYLFDKDIRNIKQLQLRSVELTYIRGSEIEIYLIKCILACSPLLKKMVIYLSLSLMFGDENGKLMFATKLLKFHRASTIAEVELDWF